MDNPFGVEGTLEMGGIGDASLITDLMAPETSTTDPDKLEGIGDEALVMHEPAGRAEPRHDDGRSNQDAFHRLRRPPLTSRSSALS